MKVQELAWRHVQHEDKVDHVQESYTQYDTHHWFLNTLANVCVCVCTSGSKWPVARPLCYQCLLAHHTNCPRVIISSDVLIKFLFRSRTPQNARLTPWASRKHSSRASTFSLWTALKHCNKMSWNLSSHDPDSSEVHMLERKSYLKKQKLAYFVIYLVIIVAASFHFSASWQCISCGALSSWWLLG